MRRVAVVAGLLTSAHAAFPAGNVHSFRLADGWGEVEWISGSSFRLTRTWGKRPEKRPPIKADRVEVERKDLGERWEYTTGYLVVTVDKSSLKLRVTDDDGEALLAGMSARQEGGTVEVESTMEPTERLYGLGTRTAADLNLRGQVVRAATPFLYSTAGYGEYYRGAGEYVFDLRQANRRIVQMKGATELEYYFYYGPSPKEVLEEHVALGAPGADRHSGDFGLLPAVKLPAGVSRLCEPKEPSWASLKDSVNALLHAGFSATLVSAFDVGPYLGADAELRERASQLASVAPVAWMSRGAVAPDSGRALKRIEDARKMLTPFLVVYAQEARERGFPIVRPMAMQFHTDAEAWKWTDQFLLGDELLVAPVLAPGGRRSVYFPRGIWTDLRTNRVYKSRQTAEIQAAADELPMFGRNGSILPVAPLTAGEPWLLHYFPKLAAEFFVLEEDLSDYTQLHASPAVETVRLEIESLKDRDYEWVVHHTGPCKRVAQVGGPEFREAKSLAELAPGRWLHDRTMDNLHVRTEARAGEHHVINVWLEVVWN